MGKTFKDMKGERKSMRPTKKQRRELDRLLNVAASDRPRKPEPKPYKLGKLRIEE